MCCCWKTPASMPARKRTIPTSPSRSRRWATSSSTTRSRAAHRAHATTEGVAHLLPSAAGRSMEQELTHLRQGAGQSRAAGDGGGGRRQGLDQDRAAGESGDAGRDAGDRRRHGQHLPRRRRHRGRQVALSSPIIWRRRAQSIHMATESGCAILLPTDVVVAKEFKADAPHRTVDDRATSARDEMVLDVGPDSIAGLRRTACSTTRTLVWNGPFGAFETRALRSRQPWRRRSSWRRRRRRAICSSVAGGGDTVAALAHAGVEDDFTYVSTAGGAFLEWLEGKELPGVEALMAQARGVTMNLERTERDRQRDGRPGQGPAGRR